PKTGRPRPDRSGCFRETGNPYAPSTARHRNPTRPAGLPPDTQRRPFHPTGNVPAPQWERTPTPNETVHGGAAPAPARHARPLNGRKSPPGEDLRATPWLPHRTVLSQYTI